jgi:hypothetical protein
MKSNVIDGVGAAAGAGIDGSGPGAGPTAITDVAGQEIGGAEVEREKRNPIRPTHLKFRVAVEIHVKSLRL